MPAIGLDYFGARYFSASQGRWTSPDWSEQPEPVPYASLEDPQTLNLYAYVRNNPLSKLDLDGHADVRIVDKATGKVTIIIPVNFKGSGATPERIQQIQGRVAAIDTGDPNTTVEVVSTNKKINGVINTLDVSPGGNGKMCGAAGECVNRVGGNKGHIDSTETGNNDAGPHEVFHFAGATDKYDEQVVPKGERVTPP